MVPFLLVAALLTMLLVARTANKDLRLPRSAQLLNIDAGMPFPEAGQASAVFSLTALFSAYLAIGMLFGLPALAGLTSGTALGLLAVHRVLASEIPKSSFHGLLWDRVQKGGKGIAWLFILIALCQLLFIVSELVILVAVSRAWLGLDSGSATIFVVTLAVLGYLYCVDGGYLAVFRTDVVQFVLIAVMAILLVLITSLGQSNDHFASLQSVTVGMNDSIWLPWVSSKTVRSVLNGCVALSMGFAFIVAGPDTWKRVSVSIVNGRKHPVWKLFIASTLPFFLVSLVIVSTNMQTAEKLPRLEFLLNSLTGHNEFVIAVILLGIVSAFLSTIDSSLLASVHLIVVSTDRSARDNQTSSDSFHRTIGLAFLLTNGVFALILLLPIKNAYLIANLLLGLFAVTAGIVVGTIGLRRSISANVVLLQGTLGCVLWCMYVFLNVPAVTSEASVDQVASVPIGALLFALIGLSSLLFSHRRAI